MITKNSKENLSHAADSTGYIIDRPIDLRPSILNLSVFKGSNRAEDFLAITGAYWPILIRRNDYNNTVNKQNLSNFYIDLSFGDIVCLAVFWSIHRFVIAVCPFVK